MLDLEISLKNYNLLCKFSFERYKIQGILNPFESKQTEKDNTGRKGRGRGGNLNLNLDASISAFVIV